MLSLYKISKNSFILSIFFLATCAFTSITFSNLKADTKLFSEAQYHVEEMMQDIKFLLEVGKTDANQGRILLTKLLDKYFDSIQIAKFSSMPAWRKATVNEKEEFIILFEKYLVNLAAMRFSEFKDVEYIISKIDKRGSKMLLVDGHIKTQENKRDNIQVAWRLILNEENNLKIIDIEIGKISMIVAQNDEFTSIIRNNQGKFSSLIDVLRKKLDN
tara:strand:- start:477 stop:1124 length:648 start_codon:yes stop_codon:yes gene_type:complete